MPKPPNVYYPADYMTTQSSTLIMILSVVTAIFACTVTFLFWRWSRLSGLSNYQKIPEGCRKLGRSGESTLSDEHSSKYACTVYQNGHTTWKVKSLFIYPVKSCKGLELGDGVCVGTGMEYDRQFAFARWMKTSKPAEKEKWGWKFLTQREAPTLATVKSEIWVPDPSSSTYSATHENVKSGGVITIRYPVAKGIMEKIVHFPFRPTKQQIKVNGYRSKNMAIWRDDPDSILMASTENHDAWIEDVKTLLEVTTPLALFRVKSMQSRQLFRNAPTKDDIGFQPTVGFQDAYPLHILSLASVQDVASKFEGGSTMLSARNFRPNILITGGQPYSEDSWKKIKIGAYEYFVSCRTVRCLLPNVNQDTGERRQEPNKTLKAFRIIDEGDPKNACLGMQMVPATEGPRRLRIGDEITVLETGEHRYIKI